MRVLALVSLVVVLGACGLTRNRRPEPATIDAVPGEALDEESEAPSGVTMQASSFVASAGTIAKAQPSPISPMRTRERLVVTGSVNVITEDVAGVVAEIRARTAQLGGTVASETINGDPQHAAATLQLRLMPDTVNPFLDWLATRARLESRHLQSSDVTRQWFERDLAIKNLEITMERLQELAKHHNAALKDVVEIEREMTRVRGELERMRGAQRLLDDQVTRATLTVGVGMKRGVHVEPELKFELLPHLSLLHIVDPQFREANRTGAGVTLMFSRWFSLDFEVFPRKVLDPRSYLFTAATGLYSDFLGGGRRRFLNPYLGFRIGGAKLDGFGAFAYGADVGLELVRYRLFLIEVTGRALGLWYRRDTAPTSDILLQGTVGLGVPF